MENSKELSKTSYSEEFKTMLNNRYLYYSSGKIKMVSSAESKERVRLILSGYKKSNR